MKTVDDRAQRRDAGADDRRPVLSALRDIAQVHRAHAIEHGIENGDRIFVQDQIVRRVEEHLETGAACAPDDLDEARRRMREIVPCPNRPARVVLVEKSNASRPRVIQARGQSFYCLFQTIVLAHAGMCLPCSHPQERDVEPFGRRDPRTQFVNLLRSMLAIGVREV